MKSTDFLFDARKNSEQNPKVPVNQIVSDYLDQTLNKIPGSKYRNLFVSFTTVPKLGINPGSTYNTPLGIYAYPADYVDKKVGNKKPMWALPFAGDSPYLNIFKSNGNVLTISNMQVNNSLIGYYEELRRVMSPFEKGEMRGGYMHYEDFVDNFIDQADKGKAKIDSPGGHLWYVTMKCAEIVSTKKGISRSLAWNWIFRQLEIDGVLDEGEGIIHEAEPTQVVFFSKEYIKVLDRVENKYSPNVVSDKKYSGEKIKQAFETKIKELKPILQSGSFDDLIKWLDYGSNSAYLSYVPPPLRLQVLQSRPYYIFALKNPIKKELYTAFTMAPQMLGSYGQRTLKLLTMSDIVNILHAANALLDKTDPSRTRTMPEDQIKYLILDVGDAGKRMDFITELIRINPYIWDHVEEYYIPQTSDDLNNYRDMVYKIAQQQNNKNVINSLAFAGYTPS